MKVTYRNKKLYFDSEAWTALKAFARLSHQSPQKTAMAALKRGIKRYAQKEKGVDPS